MGNPAGDPAGGFRLDEEGRRFITVPVSGESPNSSVSADDILELIREERILNLEEGLGPSDDLFDAGLDSLALMQMMVAAGDRFSVVFEVRDVTKENFATAEAVARLIAAKSA